MNQSNQGVNPLVGFRIAKSNQNPKPKWMLWLPVILGLLVIIPLLYFFWSKWKFVLILIVIVAIIVSIVLLIRYLKSKKVIKENTNK